MDDYDYIGVDFENDEHEASCLQCGDAIETWKIRGGVIPTYFCKHCCLKAVHSTKSSSSETIMSKTQALHYFCCTEEDLALLNQSMRRGHRQRCYLVAEVAYLAKQRTLKRKRDLERRLGVSLKDMDTILRTYLLGDYLREHQPRGQTSLDDVLKRFSVIDHVVEILHNVKLADPGAAFDFCVNNSNPTPDAFTNAKLICTKALWCGGNRICANLPQDVLKMLEKTPLKDIVSDYLKNGT